MAHSWAHSLGTTATPERLCDLHCRSLCSRCLQNTHCMSWQHRPLATCQVLCFGSCMLPPRHSLWKFEQENRAEWCMQGQPNHQGMATDLGIEAERLGLNHKLGLGLWRKAPWCQLHAVAQQVPSLDRPAPPIHDDAASLAGQMFSHR